MEQIRLQTTHPIYRMQTPLEELSKEIVFRCIDDLQQVMVECISVFLQKSLHIIKYRSSEVYDTKSLKVTAFQFIFPNSISKK